MIRVGCSGWSYDHWRGVLYPARGSTSDWLRLYAAEFDTVEVNASFYRLPQATTVRRWAEKTPAGFCFAIKASRYLTHVKRLRDLRPGLARLEERVLALRESGKLGPVLWQLPPTLRFDPGVLRAFFELLPKSLGDAERLARKHDARLRDRAVVRAEEADRPLSHALEVRHESFADPRYLDLLREHGVASCVADSAGL